MDEEEEREKERGYNSDTARETPVRRAMLWVLWRQIFQLCVCIMLIMFKGGRARGVPVAECEGDVSGGRGGN